MNGKVKFFHRNNGWGIITGEDGVDYFCHHSSLDMTDKFKYLLDGDKVSFEVEAQPKPQFKRDKAIKVKVEPTTIEEVSNADRT